MAGHGLTGGMRRAHHRRQKLDHSNFLTTVIQNNDYSPGEASTQTINLDDRSHWGGDLKTILHTNMPNVNEFMFTNKFKARVMVSRSLTKDKQWS